MDKKIARFLIEYTFSAEQFRMFAKTIHSEIEQVKRCVVASSEYCFEDIAHFFNCII